MLKKLYNPAGRRQNQVDNMIGERTYLFDYVRVAPLMVNLTGSDSLQRSLNDYTSWTRTFFDGSCCAEFAWMGNEKSSQRCNVDCDANGTIPQQESPVFAVIPGTKECWSEVEVKEKGQPKCIDYTSIIKTKLVKLFNGTLTEEKMKTIIESKPYGESMQQENAMYWLIKTGLITCNKITQGDDKSLRSHFSSQYDL